jgi:L-ascorbate metabolism protein UlaG (beta-lactamase superfamily)
MAAGGLRLTWLGHAAFRVELASGEVIYIDPWLTENPACPEAERRVEKLDALLLTHGHYDHLGDAVDLGRRMKCEVVGAFEMTLFLEKKGVQKTRAMNKGGTVSICGGRARVTMVHADHSCGIEDGGQVVYGGEACGYVLEADGRRVYHAGDTNVFGDMKLIGELYRPDVCLLPIGGIYTMGPREAAQAVRLLGARKVVPMHWGAEQELPGTPRDLKMFAPEAEVIELKPGETLAL